MECKPWCAEVRRTQLSLIHNLPFFENREERGALPFERDLQGDNLKRI